jgi:hypothetical protein
MIIILNIRFILKIIMKIFYKIFFEFYFAPYREFFAEKFSKYSVSNSYKKGEKDRSFPTISKLCLQTHFRIAVLLLYCYISEVRCEVRDAEGRIQVLISLRLKLVKEDTTFKIALLLGFEKKIDRLTFINEKNLVGSKNCCKFAL